MNALNSMTDYQTPLVPIDFTASDQPPNRRALKSAYTEASR